MRDYPLARSDDIDTLTADTTTQNGLARSLSGFANWAMNYSGMGITASIFSLFAFSFASSGPAFFWAWPLVCAGALFIALVFAELSSHYPFAGVLYKWPTILLGRRIGWWVGWMYLFAVVFLLTAYYFILPGAIIPLFHLRSTTDTSIVISLIALGVATAFNAGGIRLLGRFTEFGVVAELLILAVFTTLVLIFGAHHSPGVLIDSAGTGRTFGSWLPGFLGGGMFVALWAIYGFENAGTLGEETKEAQRKAPRSVLLALGVSFVAGLWFLFTFLLSTPRISATAKSGNPLQQIINSALPGAFYSLYLVLISFVVILGANIFFTAAARQVFAMARDGQIPGARYLTKTTANGSPWMAVLVVAIVSGLPYLLSDQLTVLSAGATAFFYFCYVLTLAIALIARLRGWPGKRSSFSLGRWGVLINVAALMWAAAVFLDLIWPRPATDPNWKLGIPVAAWLIGVPFVLGVLYYAAVQHRRLQP